MWNRMGAKFQNVSPPSNHSRKFSNFKWIFFPMVLTKLRLEVFEIFEFPSIIFFSKISNSSLYPMEKQAIWKASDCRAKRSAIYDSQVVVQDYIGYLWPCSIQGHLAVIPYTSDFFENTISKTLLILRIPAKLYQKFPCIIFSMVLTKLAFCDFLKPWKMKF